jgi:hypothetical protein
MKKSTIIKQVSLLFLLFLFLSSSSALTISNGEVSGPKDPVKLIYNLPKGKSLAFDNKTVVAQVMDFNGQTVNINMENSLSFKMKMVGKSGANLKLEIIIDSLSLKVDSPMGGSSDMKIKDVEGKTFNMIMSPFGKEIEYSEARKIEYITEGAGATNLSQAFSNIFPDLPEKGVNPGDTWTKSDSITNKTSVGQSTEIFQSVNKFEGIENIDGIECAKITSTLKGTMQTTAQNQGMDIFYSGPTQGTVTLYFAVKEGYLVKQVSVIKMSGTVDVTGPQNMSFPVTMDTTTTLEVKK